MSGLSVLYVSDNSVSWLAEDRENCVLTADLLEGDESIARTVVAMLEGRGERGQACVLALDESFYRRRQIELPAGLSPRDLAGNLNRKAANLLGTTDQALYHALPLGGNKQNTRDGIQSWLLFTLEAPRLRALMDSLRKVGFDVKRVLAAETAYHGIWQPRELAVGEAALLVGQLGTGLGVSLIGTAGLVSHNVVPTASLSRDALASALVQELRSMDSHWRRLSEGGVVTQVHLWGFDPEWEAAISPATQMVLPDVDLTFACAPVAPDPRQYQALALMVPCRRLDALSVDFTLPAAPRRSVSSMLVAASVACVATFGLMGRSGLATSVEAMQQDMRMRSDSARTVKDASSLKAEIQSLQSVESEFQSEWRAFLGTGTSNIPFGRVCGDVLRAFGDDAALESIHLTAEDSSVRYAIVGWAPPGTVRAAEALADLTGRFDELDAFGNFSLQPETRIPGSSSSSEMLQFTIDGDWDARAAHGAPARDSRGGER